MATWRASLFVLEIWAWVHDISGSVFLPIWDLSCLSLCAAWEQGILDDHNGKIAISEESNSLCRCPRPLHGTICFPAQEVHLSTAASGPQRGTYNTSYAKLLSMSRGREDPGRTYDTVR